MPFGAVYGTLFFVVVGFWLTVATLGSAGASLQTARFCLALVCLVLGLALLLRRAWARWFGALVASVLVAFHLWVGSLGDGVAANLVLFGSLAALVLLVVPFTGDVRRGVAAEKRPAPRFGRALGVLAGLGLAGFAAGVGVGLAGPATSGTSVAGSAPDAPPAIAGLSERVRWSSFGQGIERARVENKPILINFIANWCGYCQKMDRTTWKDPDVIRRSDDLVAVRVDAEEGREKDGFVGRDLAQRYQVHGYPTLVMIDSDGRELARTSGYHEAGQFIDWLQGSLARAGRMGLGNNVPSASRP